MKVQKYLQRRNCVLQVIVTLVLGAVCFTPSTIIAAGSGSGSGPGTGSGHYVGSESCFDCHPARYNDWKVSGHPYKLVSAEDAQKRPIPLPEGYGWDDISYVIGGYKWKSRYMDKEGYIITSHIDVDTGTDIPGLTQYNNLTGGWVDYHPGEKLPYNCGSCHTTGWVADEDPDTDDDLSDNQDGLPGIHGTFAFGGIHCEECHGPGSGHVNSEGRAPMVVDKSSLACGGCHIRGDAYTIPASGGFIKHHEQYNELLASPHKDVYCVECHDTHKKSEFSIIKSCQDCHQDVAESYEGTTKELVGITCQDCHMPAASKSAAALGLFKGDVKTHLFSINVDADAQMFTDDGSFVLLDDEGQGAVTLDFACVACHLDKDIKWLASKAKNFHKRGGHSAKK